MREEIIGGIKNAVERGTPLDQVKQSFMAAGYPAEEVDEAAALISGRTTSIISQPSSNLPNQSSSDNLNQPLAGPQNQPAQTIQKEKKVPVMYNQKSNAKLDVILDPVQLTENDSEKNSQESQKVQESNFQQRNLGSQQNFQQSYSVKKTNESFFSSKKFVIFLLIVFVLLIAVLIMTIIFGDKVLEFLNLQ